MQMWLGANTVGGTLCEAGPIGAAMPMKHDNGSPLWGAPVKRWSPRLRLVVMVGASVALWALIAGGIYWLTRMIVG